MSHKRNFKKQNKEDLAEELQSVGRFIKSQREKAGMSQAKVAETAQIGSHMNIARYENGHAKIPLEYIQPLSLVLKTSPILMSKKILPLYGLSFLVEYISDTRVKD